MAGGEKAFEFGNTVFIFLAALGLAWWIGTIMSARGEDKLVTACAPIEFSTNGLQSITAGLVGYTPNWTISTEKYLMSGCYYFFSQMLDTNESGKTGSIIRGGVRQ